MGIWQTGDQHTTLILGVDEKFSLTNNLQWLCFGDFNEILWNHEKSGNCLRRENQMAYFHSALEDCDLEDLGFLGKWYTWERGRNAIRNVRERLDCDFPTRSWREQFQVIGVNIYLI